MSRLRGTDPFAARAVAATLLALMFAWPLARLAVGLGGGDVTLYRPQSRMDRYAIARKVAAEPGQHVIFVQYGENRNFEWVYNGADIDASRVIWAHDLGEQKDRELMRYYAGRHFWRVLVDTPKTTLVRLP